MRKKIIITLGEIIWLRDSLGLTQEEMGRKLGVTHSAVSRWEAGKRFPGLYYADRLRRLIRKSQRPQVRIY